jgi:hypothetical protein
LEFSVIGVSFLFITREVELLAAFIGMLILVAMVLGDHVSMKRDIEIAREIQRWLVPRVPPDVPGVDIAFATRPANTVAGDYYDAFRRPGDGPLLIAVADVSGKSVPAAMLMANFQASLFVRRPQSAGTFASGRDRGPVDVGKHSAGNRSE